MDPETIRALAETLTQHLAPVLPHLAKVGDKALEEVGKKMGGGAAVEVLKKLWLRVRDKEAARELAGDPDDDLLREDFRVQIQKIPRRRGAF